MKITVRVRAERWSLQSKLEKLKCDVKWDTNWMVMIVLQVPGEGKEFVDSDSERSGVEIREEFDRQILH